MCAARRRTEPVSPLKERGDSLIGSEWPRSGYFSRGQATIMPATTLANWGKVDWGGKTGNLVTTAVESCFLGGCVWSVPNRGAARPKRHVWLVGTQKINKRRKTSNGYEKVVLTASKRKTGLEKKTGQSLIAYA